MTPNINDGQSGTPAAVDGRRTADATQQPRVGPPDEPPATDLVAAAARPGVDPCDVACAAMPAQVFGDLTPPEEGWLHGHVAGCGSCAVELDRFARTGAVLDRVHASAVALAVPPPFRRGRPAVYARLESPVGSLLVAASDVGLCEIDFAGDGIEGTMERFRRRLIARGFDPQPVPDVCGAGEAAAAEATMVDVAAQLRQYFAGRRDRFDLPLDFAGVSPFTRAVLEATAEVPFGRLDTYRAIAGRVGKPAATRAVGSALGRNPIPVVVPCHRIVRTGGALGGYTGGLRIKERLLALEGVTLV